MKYLSFDLEATGLREKDLIIEFACVPFCTEERKIYNNLSFHTFVKCPTFEELKPDLDEWVIKNNEELIRKANSTGLSNDSFKEAFEKYLSSEPLRSFFGPDKITLFGKSMAAIDLPFLNRDLGWDWMREYFEHRQLDLSSVAYSSIDMGFLPQKCTSGSELMKEVGLGEVAHTALEDAVNTAEIYIRVLNKVSAHSS